MDLPSPSYGARMWRYGLAATGPVAVAGAHFVLSFSMLRLEVPSMFGIFAALFAAAVFTIALSGALFGAPMQAHRSGSAADWAEIVDAVAAATMATALVAFLGFVLLATALGVGPVTAACYGAFAGLTILRCVGRAWTYAGDQPWRVTIADTSYALGTLATLAATVGLVHAPPFGAAFLALAIGSIVGIASLGRGFARMLGRSRVAGLRRYGAIWREQSRWSLLAVGATEAVANAHIYLLTLLMGATAVAPIAASQLLVRPINVIQNALMEYERPQMARFLGQGAMREVDRSVLLFRIVLLLVWAGTVALGAAILWLRPALVFPGDYDLGAIRLAAGLWAAVSLVIVLQVPHNALLQANGDFRHLAQASMGASAVSVAGVLIAIALGRPIWTIAAIVPGWLVSTVIVGRAARALRRRGASRDLAWAGA